MASIVLDVVTAERVVYSDKVDMVIAPGVDGELGILPNHAPLMTTLQPGELRVRKGNTESSIVVTGGFLEVRPDRVIVLADAAERAEEIDIERAEEAKRLAQEKLKEHTDVIQAEAQLRRALVRLKVSEKRGIRKTKMQP